MPSYPQMTFANFQELRNYENTEWITNGIQAITGVVGNNVVNGLLTFIEQSPLNWQKAQIVSTGGAVVAQRPVVIVMTQVPTSFSWTDNIYNQYVFLNTTNSPIPLLNGTTYYNIDLQVQTTIPALSTVIIFKANNNQWVGISFASSVATIPSSLRLVVGEDGSPIADDTTYQNDALIGLSPTKNRYSFAIDGQWLFSYGTNVSFTFNSNTGRIDLLNGNTWVDESGLELPLLKTAN